MIGLRSIAGVLLLVAVAGLPAPAPAQMQGQGELLGMFVLAAGVVKAQVHEVAGKIVRVTGERRSGREAVKVVRFENGTAVSINDKTVNGIRLREGTVIRVTYEERNGRNVATSVERVARGSRGGSTAKPQVASSAPTR